jgi:NADPH-ferrihemoprotein reductase
MTNPSPMLDTLDIVFLGTIGLGTVAWFARKQLFGRFGGASDSKSTASTNAKTAPPVIRKERNFVKVMQDQVRDEVQG